MGGGFDEFISTVPSILKRAVPSAGLGVLGIAGVSFNYTGTCTPFNASSGSQKVPYHNSNRRRCEMPCYHK